MTTEKNNIITDQHVKVEGNDDTNSTERKKAKVEIVERKTENKTSKKLISPKKEIVRGSTAKIKKTTGKRPSLFPTVHITMHVRFHTKFGQQIFITGNHNILGNNDVSKALPMHYFSSDMWSVEIELNMEDIPEAGIIYNYVLKNQDGELSFDWGNDKVLDASLFRSEKILITDAWNHPGYYENVFYTEPFKDVLLKHNHTPVKIIPQKTYTHILKIKAPLLAKGQTVCISGSTEELGEWNKTKAVIMGRREDEDFFTVRINLSKASFPFVYKYGVYDTDAKKFIRYENGNNRILYERPEKNNYAIVNDGFIVLPADVWKGAGVAIPVFSLRSNNSWGVGEFTDLKLLADWAKKTGLKVIQILPVNDTTATHTWTDSYPYAAISAFALHPMYLNPEKAAGEKYNNLLQDFASEKERLNKLDTLDYETVNKLKWEFIGRLYPLQNKAVFASKDYQEYFEQNKHWLLPYAAFCYFRDTYYTSDFNQWPLHNIFNTDEIEALFDPSSESYDEITIYLFVQYHLHVQLREATQYAHDNGIVVKGDIPIGIYRYGTDAWQCPKLYHLELQAGAPPDDFAVTGQNWGFPTYDWGKMRQNGFAWWKLRFEQMDYYFDAFRIDHVLGFFRIWSIPMQAVEGIMGYFDPAIPIHISEFHEKGILFDYDRFCLPYITDKILTDIFGDQQDHVRYTFLEYHSPGRYRMNPEFATQRLVENYFSRIEDNKHNRWLKTALYGLIANIILFEAKGSGGNQFHFRFGIEKTSSFRDFDDETQHRLRELYVNYFFRRQDDFWMKQAMQKLPALKRVTNMLLCGEDLGLVPACVPEVMKELGILSLEIQRMPKDPHKEFFDPADAPYLSVVTPSTHDMSTIREWWEEDREKTQQFFNRELKQSGYAPHFCDAWVTKEIIVQHLSSPAMWSIFQLQDILGIDFNIRREDPHEERINIPANPKHYWRYRMHLTLEKLLKAEAFNEELLHCLNICGRNR